MNKGVFRSYVIGYVLSLVLTLAAFIPVYLHQNLGYVTQEVLFVLILVLALVQLVVQLVFFLHLGRESSPKFNFIFLTITVGMIMIVMLGSLWIMNHLNYNMTPIQMEEHIVEDELLHD